MQGSGQPSVVQASAGTPYNVLFQTQTGQMPVSGQTIIAPRLALVPGGARPGAPLAAAATAAAAQGTQYRPASVTLPGMGVLLKAPPRKSGGPQQKGRKHCNCKNSRCLKLYCECFASGRYCDNCNCVSCFNNKESEAVRQSAVEAILERNPNAFRPKIQTAEGDTHPVSIRNAPDGTVRHTKGCNCKKSSCLKKYCECFQGGIFCTEICKCVDCKNYDGSEARAQVLSIQEPFNVQQLHQAAAQHALKRQRVMQAVPQLSGTAGLLQAQNALQHLAAAAAAGGPNAPAMSLQQLQALQVSTVSAAGTSSSGQQQQAAQIQQPSRPQLLDVVHDLVKPKMIEELCQLLILVAKEEGDKHQRHKQQQQQEPGSPPGADGAVANGIKQEETSSPAAEQSAPAAKANQDADGDDVMHEAGAMPEQQQQQEQKAAATIEDINASYEAQEAAVLQEFNAILQRIIEAAEKKAKSAGSTAAGSAPSATAAATVRTSQDSATGTADAEQQPVQQQQALLPQQQTVVQQPQPAVQPMQIRPQLFSLPQAQLTQQQAFMLQAAQNNYALAQLQQRALLASSAGQQLAAFPAGGLGMQLRPMGMGMQQMVQVLAQDGTVHQIPANALMSIAAQHATPAMPAGAVAAGLASAPAAALVSSTPTAAAAMPATSAAAPAGVGMSLLQLLNGAINTGNGGGSSGAVGAGSG